MIPNVFIMYDRFQLRFFVPLLYFLSFGDFLFLSFLF